MTRLLLIYFLILPFSYSSAQTGSDSTFIDRFDQLEKKIEEIQNPVIKETNSIQISIENITEIAEILNTKKSWLDAWATYLIALLTVLISTIGAYFISRSALNKQTETATEQMRSQESQTEDQLSVARDQIAETSKIATAQVRANNISNARIQWVQDLRNEMSVFLSIMTKLNSNSLELKKINQFNGEKKQDKIDQMEEMVTSMIPDIIIVEQSSSKLKLLLNPDEKDAPHKELINDLNQYISATGNFKNSDADDFKQMAISIEKLSRKVLKQAWEQAKNEQVV